MLISLLRNNQSIMKIKCAKHYYRSIKRFKLNKNSYKIGKKTCKNTVHQAPFDYITFMNETKPEQKPKMIKKTVQKDEETMRFKRGLK